MVPLVKAVQELDSENKQLKVELTDMKSRLDKLETLLFNSNNPVSSISAYLEQNTPNPVSSITIIRYHIPGPATSAVLNLTNAKDELVKSLGIQSSSTGQVSLNTAIWTSGTYNYTLYVDGKQVDTKRLVIAR